MEKNNNKKSQQAFLGGEGGVFGAKRAEQHSAGGLVVKKRGNRAQVCLVAKKDCRIWAFPKGRVDKGETLEQTALREVLEETGHKAAIIDRLDSIEYYFFLKENNTFYHKTVTFFLMKLVVEDAQPRDEEADAVGWYDAGVAKRMLSYLNEKKILAKAESLLRYI